MIVSLNNKENTMLISLFDKKFLSTEEVPTVKWGKVEWFSTLHSNPVKCIAWMNIIIMLKVTSNLGLHLPVFIDFWDLSFSWGCRKC